VEAKERAPTAAEEAKLRGSEPRVKKEKYLTCILQRQVFRVFRFVLAATSKSIWRE
jgi:hypothetical protein